MDDFYAILGVPQDSPYTGIEEAYNEKMKAYPSQEIEDLLLYATDPTFISIEEAFKTLFDPVSRREYNRAISNNANEKILPKPVAKTNNFYDLLGVPPDAFYTEIQEAYDKKLVSHNALKEENPLLFETDIAFLYIEEAYETLINTKSRQAYHKENFGNPGDPIIPDPKMKWKPSSTPRPVTTIPAKCLLYDKIKNNPDYLIIKNISGTEIFGENDQLDLVITGQLKKGSHLICKNPKSRVYFTGEDLKNPNTPALAKGSFLESAGPVTIWPPIGKDVTLSCEDGDVEIGNFLSGLKITLGNGDLTTGHCFGGNCDINVEGVLKINGHVISERSYKGLKIDASEGVHIKGEIRFPDGMFVLSRLLKWLYQIPPANHRNVHIHSEKLVSCGTVTGSKLLKFRIGKISKTTTPASGPS